ncbi:TauD/TfdA dioxygenase family protein [Siccirubricoccus phaeus]|uniref:TauD/TfdA dioxygenase family protein n=1 Tax=Siccirubricoccus phaeus TaxID=2595053 RepID=UPI001A9C4471|nr:TauD/TfdA family dioxygenase [Siccirubricoccus phaeus]
MNAIASALSVRRTAGALGAEIHGTGRLSEASDSLIAELRRLWLQHSVLFFREQHLSPAELVGFARRFGTLVEYPYLKGLAEAPEVIAIVKEPHEKANFGGTWHTDTTYLPQPPMATMLIARETPPHGGDTAFASCTAAYEALSPAMQRMLEGLRGINSSVIADKFRTREDVRPDLPPKLFEAEHPVIRTHPETGRKALFVSSSHTIRFAGMTEAESAPLLAFLFAHQVRQEFTCRFRWEPGSIAFWDNRCTLHDAINDYQGFRRVMHRVTVAGDTPF